MAENIAQFLKNLPTELITVIISMIPITELRGSIPWALLDPPLGGGLDWPSAYLCAVIGNMIPIAPLLLGIEKLQVYLSRYKIFDLFFKWLFKRTQKRGRIVEKYKALGLVLFVGIPLPITGAWTGVVAAIIFGIPFRLALLSIMGGVLLAGTIVTILSMGIIAIF